MTAAARARRHTVSVLTVVLGLALAAPPSGDAASAPTPQSVAAAAYARMTPAQRIGQLFMVGVSANGTSSTTRTALARHFVGNVILMNSTTRGVQGVATVVAPVRRTTTVAGVLPFVAVDQEGGYVQHLQGDGFSRIPSALQQGRLGTTTLHDDWVRWARQLRRAGINLDLAPVADVVPRSVGTRNQPIGRWYREYGYTPSVVSPHVAAVVRGIRAAGIATAVKHFPGLGRATDNTDTAMGVTDPTSRHDAYLAPFTRAVGAGTRFVMVSTAIYPHIDPHVIAAFSSVVVTSMLRHDLGFNGVVVTDDLLARSVSGYTYAGRAVRCLRAGVDMLLVTTGAPVAAMTKEIATRAADHASFAALVKQAVMHVLLAKARAGLIQQ